MLLLICASACTFNPDTKSQEGASTDGSITSNDGAVPGPDSMTCFDLSARHVESCALTEPDGALDLSGGTFVYDSDALTFTGPDGPVSHTRDVVGDVVVILGTTVRIQSDAVFRGVGTRPLMIASHGDLLVAGTIDVSSNDANLGAGHDFAGCGSSAGGVGESDIGGAGGGGGGGFGDVGGRGGDGDSNMNAGDDGIAIAGEGGIAVAAPTIIRGGCPGGNGGEGSPGKVGTGGASGGAIQLTAAGTITVTGMIHAGASGGLGDTNDAGGGGGGSGGYIGLDAPVVDVSGGTLAANGGGGAGGGDDANSGGPGGHGIPDRASALAGGGGAPGGTAGGAGGYADMPAGFLVTGFDTGGGGSGGGSVGFILYWTPDWRDTSATTSPIPLSQ